MGGDQVDADVAEWAAGLIRAAVTTRRPGVRPGLPLALAVVAARAKSAPHLPLAPIADELHDEAGRLDALDASDGSIGVRAMLSWSRHALNRDTAMLFDLLGLALNPAIGLFAAANLVALPPQRTRRLMAELENANLIDQFRPTYFQMNNLIKLCAAEQVGLNMTTDERGAALRRLLEYYLRTAHAGERLLHPHGEPVELDAQPGDCAPYPLSTPAEATSWFTAEHRGVIAVQHLAVRRGWHASVWQLAHALDTFHHLRGMWRDNIASWQAALDSARVLGEPAVESLALRHLGRAHSVAGQHADALDHLQRALAITSEIEDMSGRAHTELLLGRAWERLADDEKALLHCGNALALFTALKNLPCQAAALNAVGWHSARLDRYSEARTSCELAFALFFQYRNRSGEAASLDSLGCIAHCTGRYDQAVEHYQNTLDIYREFGYSYSEADTLDRLAQCYASAGQPAEAEIAWRGALSLYRSQQRLADADRLLQ